MRITKKTLRRRTNVLWKRFELGYIYAHNKIDEFNGLIDHDDNDWFYNEGTYDIHTIHASYLIPNVMDMQNFNIYLGAYYSMINSDNSNPRRIIPTTTTVTARVSASNTSSDFPFSGAWIQALFSYSLVIRLLFPHPVIFGF
ncbi:MAG: hypothetical protein ACFWT4_04600 [Citrobacter braakii]